MSSSSSADAPAPAAGADAPLPGLPDEMEEIRQRQAAARQAQKAALNLILKRKNVDDNAGNDAKRARTGDSWEEQVQALKDFTISKSLAELPRVFARQSEGFKWKPSSSPVQCFQGVSNDT